MHHQGLDTVTAVTAVVSLIGALGAADANAQLEQLIAKNRYVFELSEESFDGPGAQFLLEQGRRAAFYVVGESHGNRETPWLTKHLLEKLRPAGYVAYALETGPVSTDYLVEDLREHGRAAVEKILKEHPFTSAFLNFRGDLDVVETAVRAGYRVWGIDQEFIGSGRFLLARLEELAPNPEATKLVREWREKAKEGFARFVDSGDASGGFMSIVTDGDFDALDAAFATASTNAHRILEAMRASARVYRHFAEKRYFQNNTDRIRLMKHYLLTGLNSLDADQRNTGKVLIKLGSAHAGRGFSPFDQLDIGNQAAELGFVRGSDSFNVYVYARKSVQADGASRDLTADAEQFAPLFEPTNEERAIVIDLRPLRPWLEARQTAMPELHREALRFDAAVILPAFHAAEQLVPMPARD